MAKPLHARQAVHCKLRFLQSRDATPSHQCRNRLPFWLARDQPQPWTCVGQMASWLQLTCLLQPFAVPTRHCTRDSAGHRQSGPSGTWPSPLHCNSIPCLFKSEGPSQLVMKSIRYSCHQAPVTGTYSNTLPADGEHTTFAKHRRLALNLSDLHGFSRRPEDKLCTVCTIHILCCKQEAALGKSMICRAVNCF